VAVVGEWSDLRYGGVDVGVAQVLGDAAACGKK